ncbi:unnamed protein product [Fusarium langsethiae]|nr:unnamed protein product [Fusarium langsethiae]
MEVGGFAVGAVGLVSLLKDCVDLYSMFKLAQNLDEDAKKLKANFEVEKTLFFEWFGEVGLLYQDPKETEFSGAHNRDLIICILEQIRDLLSDGKKLQAIYGMRNIAPMESRNSSMESNDALESISTRRRAQLLIAFGRMKIKDTFQRTSSSTLGGVTKQISWAIGDKEKFDRLITDLSYFNRSLVALTLGTTSNLTAKDLSHISSIANLNSIVEALKDSNHTHQEAAEAARRLAVKDAHKKTFQWTLDPSAEECRWHHFPSWLQSGTGIYWLFGKAGSGKSTLMKFLHDNERTQQYLKVWSGESELVFISFFFYALGQREQKSQVGLLRSLLYQILSRDASLVETVLPNAWREASSGDQKKPEDLPIPSVAEMMKALKDIVKLYRDTKKMFFLIDGIDEYEGQDIDVAAFISELGGFSNVKVLVSSRPHNAFVTAFRELPSMNLPDLTERDITSYVDDTVASHPNMRAISAMDPKAVTSITRSLIERASGVFLWVVLVCRSVIEGCDNCESASDLQYRVNESPEEVEDLLQLIMESIPPRWKDEAMKIMYLLHTKHSCQMAGSILTLGLYLICEQGISSDIHCSKIQNMQPLSKEEIDERCHIMERRLQSKCRGIVEVERNLGIIGKFRRKPYYSNVDFMHRTVYDLISQPGFFDRQFGKIIRQGFNAHFVLCNLMCQLIMTCQLDAPAHRSIFFTTAISIIHGGKKKGCTPDILLHCLSRIQYVSAMSRPGDRNDLQEAKKILPA